LSTKRSVKNIKKKVSPKRREKGLRRDVVGKGWSPKKGMPDLGSPVRGGFSPVDNGKGSRFKVKGGGEPSEKEQESGFTESPEQEVRESVKGSNRQEEKRRVLHHRSEETSQGDEKGVFSTRNTTTIDLPGTILGESLKRVARYARKGMGKVRKKY